MSDDYKLQSTSGQSGISGLEVYKASQKQEKHGQDKREVSTKDTDANSSDQVSLSEESVLYSKIMKEALDGEPTMERQEEINKLKQQIAEGSYTINPHKIARNLLTEESKFDL